MDPQFKKPDCTARPLKCSAHWAHCAYGHPAWWKHVEYRCLEKGCKRYLPMQEPCRVFDPPCYSHWDHCPSGHGLLKNDTACTQYGCAFDMSIYNKKQEEPAVATPQKVTTFGDCPECGKLKVLIDGICLADSLKKMRNDEALDKMVADASVKSLPETLRLAKDKGLIEVHEYWDGSEKTSNR